jgi:phenol hydroxylase P1 protein
VQVDIKTSVIIPKRNTFRHLAERFGEDRVASRYEEGTYDVQSETNFHYRPIWQPEYEIFDRSRTVIKMRDWYDLKDPRQYYYATYNIARAKQQDSVDQSFETVEKQDLLALCDPAWLDSVKSYLLPLRHYEWGANMNHAQLTAHVWGAAFGNACCFAMGDRLGLAQLIGRIGLLLSGNTEELLDNAKKDWLEGSEWQGLRRLVEDSFVIADPIELFVAQDLAFDGIIHGLVHGVFRDIGKKRGAVAFSFLTSFIDEWRAETTRWVDSVLKTIAAESDENRAQLKAWRESWTERAVQAALPLAEKVLGSDGAAALEGVRAALEARAAKLGIA